MAYRSFTRGVAVAVEAENIEQMLGKTLTEYTQTKEELTFKDELGNTYRFYHEQDCCESVNIADITGDLEDLIGSPILFAEESSSRGEEAKSDDDDYFGESHTWTFYTFRTHKGTVQVRWLGNSNGYYSETVAFLATGPSFSKS